MLISVFKLAMSQNPKVSRALAVTRALGIEDEKIKPILKNLLKLYGKNWELIEEDNYRTLLDAYFELNENKETDDKNPSMVEKDGLERPAKRVCMENQASVSDRAQYSSGLLHAHNIDERKRPVSSHLPLKVAKMRSMEKESSVLKKYSMAEGGSLQVHKQSSKELVKSKMESPSRHSLWSCEHSSSHPQGSQQPLDISSSRNYSMKSLASSKFDMNKGDDSSTRNDYSSGWKVEIASSSLGEIKIFLDCRSNYFQTFRRSKLESVMKLVEEKYRCSYKVMGQNISIVKLLNDLCECYLKVVKDSPGRWKIVGASEGASNASNICEELKKKAIWINDSEKYSDLKVHNSNDNTSSNGNMVVQKHPSTCDRKRSCNLVDITKGTENVKISLIDESGEEELPTFNYIPHSIVYQNAHVQFSLARISDEDCCSSCSGDCLSSTLPCACARETGGEFAYTPQGLLKEEFLDSCIAIRTDPQEGHLLYCQDCPIERAKNELKPEKCNGHLVRKFVKECWRKCGCALQCSNRVVQRGITRKLQVFLTEGGKGWGVRTVEDLPKGAFVCEYVGEIVTNTELFYRNMETNANERHTYPVLLDADWGSEGVLQDEEALCLDATYHGNVARFINHRCFDANLIDIPVEVETPDRHYYHLAFFTTKKIGAFEELTWDYGIDFADHNHPVKAFRCSCGSAYCRDIKRKGSSTSRGITMRR